MDIEKLISELFNLKYNYRWYDGSYDKREVIDEQAQNVVKETILKWFNENRDTEIGKLQAKVYVYEKIIANSNFRPILDNDKKENDNEQK